jgi:chromosome segregation ATPase
VTDDEMVSVPLSWSEQYEELKAERDRLRAVVENPDGVVEAMHARLDEAQHEQVVLVAERDRLREAIDADRPMQIANLKALTAERDRLRRALHESAGLEEKMAAAGYALRTVEEFDELAAERDRLRTVVLSMQECSDCATCRRHATVALMGSLDGSPDMGETP